MFCYTSLQSVRLLRELDDLLRFPSENLFTCTIDVNKRKELVLHLDYDSQKAIAVVSTEYPFRQPCIMFCNELYHPNICPYTNTLKLDWSCASSLKQLCIHIRWILEEPMNCCVNPLAYNRWLCNKKQYKRIQKHWQLWFKFEPLFHLTQPDIVLQVLRQFLQ